MLFFSTSVKNSILKQYWEVTAPSVDGRQKHKDHMPEGRQSRLMTEAAIKCNQLVM